MGEVLNTSSSSISAQATFALLGVVACLALGTWAALSYPGGTHWDPTQEGFGWTSFWCDLLRPVALNGADNSHGARIAQGALLALALGLGPFFSLARDLLGLHGARLLTVLTLAYLGRIALILVAAGTGRLPAVVHDWAILLGGPAGLLAFASIVVWSFQLHRALGLVGLSGLALGLWNLLQYGREAVLRTPSWPGLPIVQKAATLSVLAFLVLFSLRGLERRATDSPSD